MIKRTLYFGNPAYLSLENSQLIFRLPQIEKNNSIPDSFKKQQVVSIPIEDIGVVILDDTQITITQRLLSILLENNTAVITCNDKHMPSGLLLPLEGNLIQQERYDYQIAASIPLKKQLWQQTIQAKIHNQAYLLRTQGIDDKRMLTWEKEVKSGDSGNYESRSAVYYWSKLFSTYIQDFKRGREEAEPNNLLNYGYAILRAVIARALVGTGLLTTLGIFHRNRYNAYCLADDIMEPYRPYVDQLVLEILQKKIDIYHLNKEVKQQLLTIPAIDVMMEGERSPLMIAAQRTAFSLYSCYEGRTRKLNYPAFE